MRTRDAVGLVIVAFVVGALLRGCYDDSIVEAATVEAARADSAATAALARADRIASERREAERADSARLSALIDSTDVWRRRADALRVEAEAARRRADAVATELVASLNAEQTEQFGAYVAERDSIEATLRSEIRDKEEESARLWEARESMAALYDAAVRESESLRVAYAESLIAIEARERVIRAQGRENRLLKIAGVALLGLAAYDRLGG